MLTWFICLFVRRCSELRPGISHFTNFVRMANFIETFEEAMDDEMEYLEFGILQQIYR